MIPYLRASSAEMVRPVSRSSAATAGPTSSGRKCVPPKPGMKQNIIYYDNLKSTVKS